VPILRRLSLLFAIILLAVLAGCAGETVQPTPEAAPEVPERPEKSDQARLKDALMGREMPPSAEVVDLSDRLLNNSSAINDEETMARLELVLLKALKAADKDAKPAIWRNLGLIHYHQRKFKEARQELQSAIELNPKDARSRFYLSRVFTYQGEIYEKQGKTKLARKQFKRAAIEMEMARKLDPGNPLYRQNPTPPNGRE
jgi:tetratricopeptide (TPR) repeat protein